MKNKRKALVRKITLAAGAALMSGTLLFGSSYTITMAQETDSQALDENTAADTGTTPEDTDTSSGDTSASSGGTDTSSEDTGSTSGDTDTSSGDSCSSQGDADTSSGDTGTSQGDADTSSEDDGTSTADPKASLGDTAALSERPEAPNALIRAPANDEIEISDWATLQKYFNTGSSGDYVLTADLHQGPNDFSLHLNTPAQHSERYICI